MVVYLLSSIIKLPFVWWYLSPEQWRVEHHESWPPLFKSLLPDFVLFVGFKQNSFLPLWGDKDMGCGREDGQTCIQYRGLFPVGLSPDIQMHTHTRTQRDREMTRLNRNILRRVCREHTCLLCKQTHPHFQTPHIHKQNTQMQTNILSIHTYILTHWLVALTSKPASPYGARHQWESFAGTRHVSNYSCSLQTLASYLELTSWSFCMPHMGKQLKKIKWRETELAMRLTLNPLALHWGLWIPIRSSWER